MPCWGGRSGAAEAAIHGGQVGRRVDVLPARVIVDSEFEQRPAVAGEHGACALVAVERALWDPADRMVVIEAASQVAVTVARVISLAALARAARDRADRLREDLHFVSPRSMVDLAAL